MKLVKWELKVRKELDLGLEKKTLRNRGGTELGMGTRNGRMECLVQEMKD